MEARYVRSLEENKITDIEKKNNAEVPTPVELVKEMLAKIPTEFWSTGVKPHQLGKGNPKKNK